MNSFSQHIERIKSTKRSLDKLTADMADKNIASASIACMWESFFDILFNSEGLTISDLNTMSGVIQKLISSDNQLSENGLSQWQIAEKELALKNLSAIKLSAKNIKQVEEQLKLI